MRQDVVKYFQSRLPCYHLTIHSDMNSNCISIMLICILKVITYLNHTDLPREGSRIFSLSILMYHTMYIHVKTVQTQKSMR